MEQLTKTIRQIKGRVVLVALSLQIFLGLICGILLQNSSLPTWEVGIIFLVGSIFSAYIVGWLAGHLAGIPLQAFGAAIMHIAPGQTDTAAPDFSNLEIGREYVTSLAYQLYQIASLQDNKILAEHRREATQASNILTRLPLPLVVFNKDQVVTFGSDAVLSYCGLESAQLFGKPLFENVDLEFTSEFTLEAWIKDCQANKATDTANWSHVRLHLKDEAGTVKQCDMAGYYNRDNPTGIEFIITMFDKTAIYSQDDKSLSFVALALHELRTPLTVMRALLEVIEDEFGSNLQGELGNYMRRLKISAQQLSAFTNNILNVARVDENQLAVKLREDQWSDVIKPAISDMNMRAEALGKQIKVDTAPDLPSVAVDRMTIYEVLCNLLDNALKYSGKSNEVMVRSSLNNEGLVETVIEDHGLGIPTSAMPELFEKFRRSHHTKAQVSGTGLGLFLCKAIVNAHGGDIWVRSKEGEGTTVGFTIKPYHLLADELKNSNNGDEMVRTAHGWIKNHSLYRR